MRTLTPFFANALHAMTPAGPAPMMSTSTWLSGPIDGVLGDDILWTSPNHKDGKDIAILDKVEALCLLCSHQTKGSSEPGVSAGTINGLLVNQGKNILYLHLCRSLKFPSCSVTLQLSAKW